jgi:site-specific recombinase XerD
MINNEKYYLQDNAAAITSTALLQLSESDMTGLRLTEKTIAIMLSAQKHFLDWLSARACEIEHAGKYELREYHNVLCNGISSKTGKPLAANTVNTHFSAACKLFALLQYNDIIKENPADGLKLALPVKSSLKRRPLMRDELEQLLSSFNIEKKQGLKDRTLFELLYSSALRVSEVVAIKIADINFDTRFVLIHGKGNRDRVVPFSTICQTLLLRYLGERVNDTGAYLFPGAAWKKNCGHVRSEVVTMRFKKLMRKLGIDKPEISTHSIRHSAASHLVEDGAGIRQVQELLGHQNIETTVRYTQLQTATIHKALNSNHPRYAEMECDALNEYRQKVQSLMSSTEKTY